MFRGQSIFLGAAICLANVFVIAALSHQPSREEHESPKASEKSPSDSDAASRAVTSDRPTLEFRRFLREQNAAVAEFCFTNRSGRAVFMHRADLLRCSDEVKAAGSWYFNDAALECGVGVLGRRPDRIEPGDSFSIYGYICPWLQEYVPVGSKGAGAAVIGISEAEAVRKVVYYSTTLGGPTTAVRSEPVDIRAKWCELAARHDAKRR